MIIVKFLLWVYTDSSYDTVCDYQEFTRRSDLHAYLIENDLKWYSYEEVDQRIA
jgi:hypothetical protein